MDLTLKYIPNIWQSYQHQMAAAIAASLLGALVSLQARGVPDDLARHVSILGGTRSRYVWLVIVNFALCSLTLTPHPSLRRFDYGTGSLLPFVGRPWGMNNWAIQTNNYAGAHMGPMTHWLG